MAMEYIIVFSLWIISIVVLIFLIPKNKIRQTWAVFMFAQSKLWLFGLIMVQLKLIKFPVRIFSYASRSAMSYESIFITTIAIIFILYYPIKKSLGMKFIYYAVFASGLTILEVILEKNTNLVSYINWSWYWTWLRENFCLYLCWLYYRWFFIKGAMLNQKQNLKKDGV